MPSERGQKRHSSWASVQLLKHLVSQVHERMQIERTRRLVVGHFQSVALHGFVEKAVQRGDGWTELEAVIAFGFESRLVQQQQAGQAL